MFLVFFDCVVDSSMATSRDSLGKSNKRTVRKAFICTCCPLYMLLLLLFFFPFPFLGLFYDNWDKLPEIRSLIFPSFIVSDYVVY
jgi:Na+-driven multidrug efflux pump